MDKPVYVLMERDYGGLFSSPFLNNGYTHDEEFAKQWVSDATILDRDYKLIEELNETNKKD